MSVIQPETITKLTEIQNQIWQTVSLTVGEACGQAVTFASPLCVSAKTADLYSEIGAAMMVIQFAFADLPENPQVVLIPQETVQDLASLILNDTVEQIDENTVADIRIALEGIVQGLCLSVGNILNSTIVASGLSIRHQVFSFPPSLQRNVALVRTQ